MFLWDVAVLELDSHSNLNKRPVQRTLLPSPSKILSILQAANQPFDCMTFVLKYCGMVLSYTCLGKGIPQTRTIIVSYLT